MMAMSMGLSCRSVVRWPLRPVAPLKAIARGASVTCVTAIVRGACPTRLPIAVLVSGAGTNLQALLDTVHGREADIVAVASSVADAPALSRAQARDVPTAVFARADLRRPQRARPRARRLAGRARRAAGRARRLHGAARRAVPRALSRRRHQRAPLAAAGVPGARRDRAGARVRREGVRRDRPLRRRRRRLGTGDPPGRRRAARRARRRTRCSSALRPLEHSLLPRRGQRCSRAARSAPTREPASRSRSVSGEG